MFTSRRQLARRRTHDFNYALIALCLIALAAIWPCAPIGLFGPELLTLAQPHAWPFLALIFAPSACALVGLIPTWIEWRAARPYVYTR